LADCLQAIELQDSFAFYDSLGFVYLRLGRNEDAIEVYDVALDKRANSAHSLFGRALAKRGLGDQDGYDQDMADALRWQPEIGAAFERYGVTP
jgi:tetratricopeptide (TPR) repeat protein